MGAVLIHADRQTDGRTDGRTDMTEPIGASRKYANMPKNRIRYRTTVLNFFRPTWFWNFFSRPKWNDIAGGDIEQNSEDNIWTYKRGRKGKMNKITTREVS